jgi:hypothetical protein
VRGQGAEHLRCIKKLQAVVDVSDIGIVLNSMRIVEMKSIIEMVGVAD